MKALIALLLPLTVSAKILEYKEVVRSYKNLDQLDLSECERTFRFVNDNWMDCRLHLPQLISSPIAQIGYFEVKNVDTTTSLSTDMNYLTGITTSYRDMDEASVSTHLLIDSYYQKPGDYRIHYAPKENYRFSIFREYLLPVLANFAPSNSTIIAYDSKASSPYFDDKVLGNVYIGESTDSPDAEECLKNYEHAQEDNWPQEEEIWYSQCTHYKHRDYVSVSLEDFWSKKLKERPTWTTKIVALKENMVAKIVYSRGGFKINLGRLVDGAPDFNLNLSPEEAAPLIREAAKLGGKMKAHFFALDEHLARLSLNERIIGQLVLRQAAGKDEIDFRLKRVMDNIDGGISKLRKNDVEDLRKTLRSEKERK